MKKLFTLFSIVLFAASLSAQVVNSCKLFSSQTGNYSVEVPENWKSRIEFSNQYTELDHIIVEKSSYVSSDKAIVYIDCWSNNKNESLESWINRMHWEGIFTFKAEDCNMVRAGLLNHPALKYTWIEPTDNRRQAWDMDVVFMAVDQRIFKFTYHKADDGRSQAAFDHIVKTFMEEGAVHSDMLETRNESDLEIFPEGTADRGVQTCNGNSTCGTNPYDCCSYGNCVWWAWRHARCNWGVSLTVWGNASNWYGGAISEGYVWTNTSSGGNAGSIACWRGNNHVGVLSSVANSQATLHQMSCTSTPTVQPYNQLFASTATANFGYFSPKPRLASNITINPNPFKRNAGNNIAQVSINKPGPMGFYGKISAAFHAANAPYSYVRDLQVYNTASQNANTTSTWTFSTPGYNLPTAGTYRLQIKYQVNGTGGWFLFPGNNNILVTVANSLKNDGNNTGSLVVAPNPSNGFFELAYFPMEKIISPSETCDLELIDVNGRIVMERLGMPLTEDGLISESINASNLANGLYMLRLKSEGKTLGSQRLMIEK